MNLSGLFQMQKILDDHIMDEHPELKGQDNLDWKILALQVEIGECANEWRGFKKWSKDQEPRLKVVVNDPLGQCEGYTKYPLLEEFVDCLHFILSIGLELGITTLHEKNLNLVDERLDNITIMFHQLYACASNLYWSFCYKVPNKFDFIELFQCFIKLGAMLGFTWDQIEQAYFAKNAVNHQRQEQGY